MSSLSAEARALLTLRLLPGLGPVRIAALRERFGTAEAALQAGVAELAEVPSIGDKLAHSLVTARQRVDVDRELAQVERFGVRLVAQGTAEYPAILATIPDPPPLLYLRGTLTPADGNAVALVGSRHGSDYGKRMATRLAAGLARAGFTIVSGLARGVDGAAHRAALQASGRTLAVLAGGLSRIYPPEHTDLAREVEAAGAVLTESPMGQESLPGLFPVRNRIISGLARAVVVVEAAERSGALSTASHAAEQGRTVLAVPGPADTETSGGCNELIRKGAVLCRSVEDVLEELHGVSALVTAQKAGTLSVAPPPPAAPPPGLDETQRRVWECLAEGPRHLDELVQRLGLGVPLLSGTLLMLEMKKTVRRLPGSRYEIC